MKTDTLSLEDRVTQYIASGFGGIWIRSFEHPDVDKEVTNACLKHGRHAWRLYKWDADVGMTNGSEESQQLLTQALRERKDSPSEQDRSPHAALDRMDAICEYLSHFPDEQESPRAVLLARNLLMQFTDDEGRVIDPVLLQKVQNVVEQGNRLGVHLLVVSCDGRKMPLELEKLFASLDHDLPGREGMLQVAKNLVAGQEGLGVPDDPTELEHLIDSAMGLTRSEAEAAFALALQRDKPKAEEEGRDVRMQPDVVWDLKAQTLQDSGLLHMYRGGESFESLGGLDHIKQFCLRAFQNAQGNPRVRPRGATLIGVPGTGKSAFAKALGNEVGRPTVFLDIGALMGSLVGQTESNIRRALKTVDAVAPCVLFVDEIEKALAGSSGGDNDSGVGARLLGTLLSWLQDHESDVFFLGTSNDVSKLPPEFTRAERFDALFFMDLPGREQKDKIWDIYIPYFELDPDQEKPDDEGWTGAEIRSCCRLAALFEKPLVDTAKQVVPVSRINAEKIEELRKWAENRCLSADYEGVFTREMSQQVARGPKPKRRRARSRKID